MLYRNGISKSPVVEVRKICTAGKRSGTEKSFSDAAGIEYEPKATIPVITV